ncbi:GPN-loop GTPase [Achaetomium macrosporum]|uniref:GPN-loop GTPase 3 n=1 Tax=Achaetomium macrosporum TaxID=79813 RepID=A0AAN7CGV4_9PEZI|nr:GPN-loop GTPase [Achaetomium macrosporum]
MSKFGLMVMGPAGVGKSTFCASLITHLQLNRRSAFYVNLDPAAEHFEHQPDLDIKDLISVEDVMDEMQLGPNGGLVYCFEYLMQNLDFLTEGLESLTDEYLIIFDVPGQIELYTHIPILPDLVKFLSRPGALDIRLCAAYLLEGTSVLDRSKYFSGSLSAMSAMIMLELPHINILSKWDLVKDQLPKKQLKRFKTPDTTLLEDDPVDVARRKAGIHIDPHNWDSNDQDAVLSGTSFKRLNTAVANLIERFSLVQYFELDCTDEESVGAILSHIDYVIQYHEAQEPKEPPDEE